MAKKNKQPNPLIAELVAALTPKVTKLKKSKFILIVDGVIPSDMITMKEAEKAAKRLATTSAKVEVFSSLGVLATDLKVKLTKGK